MWEMLEWLTLWNRGSIRLENWEKKENNYAGMNWGTEKARKIEMCWETEKIRKIEK